MSGAIESPAFKRELKEEDEFSHPDGPVTTSLLKFCHKLSEQNGSD
jgi:hypothetical protein